MEEKDVNDIEMKINFKDNKFSKKKTDHTARSERKHTFETSLDPEFLALFAD